MFGGRAVSGLSFRDAERDGGNRDHSYITKLFNLDDSSTGYTHTTDTHRFDSWGQLHKPMMKMHYAQDTLAKMGRSAPAECRSGCGDTATFFHILWDCPIIQRFWTKIVEYISKVPGETF